MLRGRTNILPGAWTTFSLTSSGILYFVAHFHYDRVFTTSSHIILEAQRSLVFRELQSHK